MYNGIGLDTARGSGTNGYVQRNLSFIRRHKDKVDYKSEEELKKLDAHITKGPNKDILDHERKRKVELKCMEMQELMEEQGYGEEEIELKVSTFRQMLMEKVQETNTGVVEKDECGRPVAKATHQLAEANQARNEQLKAAFGLSEFYKEGSSMDPQRKTKEEAAKALALAQKKYSILSDEEDAAPDHHHSAPKIERRKHNPSENDTQEKKRKKHRREQSESPSPERRKHHKSPEVSLSHKISQKNELSQEKKGKHKSDRGHTSPVAHKKKRPTSRSRSSSVEDSRRKPTRSSPDVSRDRKSSKKSHK